MAKKYSIAKRQRSKNSAKEQTLSHISYTGNCNTLTSLDLIQYDLNGATSKKLSGDNDLKKEINHNKINWFRITGMTDVSNITKICHDFGLYTFDIKELISEQKLVKVVEYDNITFILMSGFYGNETNELNNMQIGFIIGKDYVVSFKEAPICVFEEVRKAIMENNTLVRQKGVDYLLYLLLNSVNTLNANLIMKAEDQLAEVEDKLITQDEDTNILLQLHTQRIDYMHIKRFILSFREEYNNLQHNTNKLIQPENLIYFNDFDDKMRTSLGNLDDLHESIKSLLDLYYNNNNLKMNSIMKRLTVVSTIFIPLTFLVGVWGMNFKFMPELNLKYGYIVAWSVLVVIGAGLFFLLKRNKWF